MTGQFLPMLAFSVLAAVLSVVIRQYQPAYGPVITLGAITVLLTAILPRLSDIFASLLGLSEFALIEETSVVVKCVMLSIMGGTGADICADCNQQAFASKVTLFTRIAIITACLPLLRRILEIIKDLNAG